MSSNKAIVWTTGLIVGSLLIGIGIDRGMDAYETATAMQNGYEQVVEHGDGWTSQDRVLWKKKGSDVRSSDDQVP